MNISFTGKPPFVAVWNDGVTTTSSNATATRAVTKPGEYRIDRFNDATCAGTASGTANFPYFVPTYKLATANGTCDTATLVATFSGVPPFIGTWSDGVAFTTSQTVLERKVKEPGRYSLSFRDANCEGRPGGDISTSTILDNKAPTATLSLLCPVRPGKDAAPIATVKKQLVLLTRVVG